MIYKWGTWDAFNYNHLYDENLRWLCSSYNQDSTFFNLNSVKYYPNKEHCPMCSKKSLNSEVKIIIPKTYCGNVLHINRKIFI